MIRPLATVRVNHLGQMHKAQRRKLALWLRRVADRVVKDGPDYVEKGVTTFRFIVELERR